MEGLIAATELHLGDLVSIGKNRGALRLLNLDPLSRHGRDYFAVAQDIEFRFGVIGCQLVLPGLQLGASDGRVFFERQ